MCSSSSQPESEPERHTWQKTAGEESEKHACQKTAELIKPSVSNVSDDSDVLVSTYVPGGVESYGEGDGVKEMVIKCGGEGEKIVAACEDEGEVGEMVMGCGREGEMVTVCGGEGEKKSACALPSGNRELKDDFATAPSDTTWQQDSMQGLFIYNYMYVYIMILYHLHRLSNYSVSHCIDCD